MQGTPLPHPLLKALLGAGVTKSVRKILMSKNLEVKILKTSGLRPRRRAWLRSVRLDHDRAIQAVDTRLDVTRVEMCVSRFPVAGFPASVLSVQERMPMLAILHLGDIHIREGRVNPVMGRARLIASAIKTLVAPASELYLVLAGDIAFAGKQSEYEAATAFLAELDDALRNLQFPRYGGAVAVPGNHDCDFDEAGDLREPAIAGVAAKLSTIEPDGKSAAELLSVQKAFFGFLARVTAPTPPKPALSWQIKFIGQHNIVFRCLNTAWVSMLKEKAGQILYPPQAVPAVDGDNDLVCTVMHHPYGWLQPNNKRTLRRILETSSDLILTGHEHESESYSKIASDGTVTNFVEGAALHDPSVRENGFNVILLDPKTLTYQVCPFFWRSDLYEQQHLTSGIFTRNQKLLEHNFQNSEEFRLQLDRIGTPFSHEHKTDLKLSDLFVYPDLRITDFAGKSDKVVRSAQVLQYVTDSPRFRIYGAPTSGRTSLAKTLYRDLLEKKKIVPVLIDGGDFSNITYESVVGVITRNFKRQYSDKLYTRFSQLENDERIFIVDDWQNFALNDEGEQLVLEALERYGARILLISDEAQVLRQVHQLAKSEIFAKFAFAEIKQFQHVLRSELIRKWILLGREFQMDDLELTAAIDEAEHLLDTLVMTGVVPSYPVFVCSALQARSNGAAANAIFGSFGHIYEQLLTTRLGKHGQKLVAAKLTLLSRVAFKMFSAGRDSITEEEYTGAERLYAKEYAVSGNIIDWRLEFVESQIIQVETGEVKFTYKYAYYFLLAWFFHDGISNAQEAKDLKERLVGMVEAAHVEVNVHTLVFYLYLSRDRELIERIVAKAKSTLPDVKQFDVTIDLEFANSLCNRHPTILAPPIDHRANRQQRNEERDAVLEEQEEQGDDGKGDAEGVEIDRGFTLLDIMGQVVRNFPLDLRADLKFQLTAQSYALSRRLETSFLESVQSSYEPVVASLQTFMKRHQAFAKRSEEEIAYASNMFLVSFVEGVTMSIIKKLSFSIGIQELRETYQEVRAEAGEADISTRLIDLAITLEHFACIPVPEVEQLKESLQTNVVGYGLLRMLVGEYLALFPCDYKTRQRVEKLMDFRPNDPQRVLDRRVRALPAKNK